MTNKKLPLAKTTDSPIENAVPSPVAPDDAAVNVVAPEVKVSPLLKESDLLVPPSVYFTNNVGGSPAVVETVESTIVALTPSAFDISCPTNPAITSSDVVPPVVSVNFTNENTLSNVVSGGVTNEPSL